MAKAATHTPASRETFAMMMPRAVRSIGVAIAAIAMVLAGVWAALAIWFRLIAVSPARDVLAGGILLLAIAAAICLAMRRWRIVAVYAVAIVAVFGWWASLTPSNDRDWSDDVARMATGTVAGNKLVMRNVRNFLWRSDTDYDAGWETRSYDLDDLSGVDLFLSYWAGESIAHTILSFGFSNGQQLAFSIEIRKEKSESYSPIAGFFRAYELAFVAADERDVIGVRTNVRGEDVRIYRLRMAPAQARSLLLEYVREANDLAREPRFYNSLTANCSTQVFRMVRALRPDVPLDYRMVANGHAPDFVYELGGLDTALPFAVLRDRSHIRGKAESDDPGFSAKIRRDVPAAHETDDRIPQ